MAPAVVYQFLVQSVTDSQRHGPDHLPIHDHVVDDGPAVFYTEILLHLDHSRLGVNPGDRQVGSVAEGLVRRIKRTCRLKTPFDVLR